MASYIANRLLMLIFVSLGVTSLVFVVTRVLPGDPVAWAAGLTASPKEIEHLRSLLRLDQPLWSQYVYYLRGLIRGDLGISMYTRRPVFDDIVDFFPATVELALAAILLTMAISLPIGVLAATRHRTNVDSFVSVLTILGAAVPVFWLGLVLQLFLYADLGWFPVGGRLAAQIQPPPRISGLMTVDALVAGRPDVFVNALYHLALPTLALALQRCAVIARLVRVGMLEILRQDYVRTARAKGLRERRVLFVHALRNAALPVVTWLGLQFGWLLGGTILVEVIFQWPGVGRYAVEAIALRDYSPIAAVTLIVSVVFILLNLAIDLLYGVLDPRVKY